MLTCNAVQTNSQSWIVDTGATNHMTPSLALLHNVKPLTLALQVNLPTGATATVTHVKDLICDNSLQLLNVLHVPTFTHNLLSIQKLSVDNNCYVVFLPNEFSIVSTATQKVLCSGTIHNGLYQLLPSASSHVATVLKCFTTSHKSLVEEFTLWYNRLGHALVSKINHIECAKHCALITYNICLTCPMAKYTKLPFSINQSHASTTFDLLHTDIWGPYRISARQKFNYFLILVDDYSRMTWIYLLQHKSDYLQSLELFQCFILKQFCRTLKVVRSDNAKEFNDVSCT